MNETDKFATQGHKRAFQFRLGTLLWIMVVAASFFAGRYTALPKGGETMDVAISTTWNPGYSVPFAIAGPIDIDSDGSDDTAMIKNLISKNGGTIIASQDSTGSISGKIDAKTRYLVVENPTDPAITANKLVSDAKQLSIPLISADKLLKRMGIQPGEPTNGFQARNN